MARGSHIVGRSGGEHGSENAGVSRRDVGGESYTPIAQGFQGKVRPPWVSRDLTRRPKGVVDGKRGRLIPVPAMGSEGMTEKASMTH